MDDISKDIQPSEGAEEISAYMESVRGDTTGDRELDKEVVEETEPDGEEPFTGENPLLKKDGRALKTEGDEPDALERYLDDFNLHAPLTDFEKEVLERGVNDEVFDVLREKIQEAGTAGDIEKTDKLRKLIAVYERVKDKGLHAHYIEIDKDTGEIVRGTYGENAGLLEKGVPEPPPEKSGGGDMEKTDGDGSDGETEGEVSAGGEGEGDGEEPPPLQGESEGEGEGEGAGDAPANAAAIPNQGPSAQKPAQNQPPVKPPAPTQSPEQSAATSAVPVPSQENGGADDEKADANMKANLQGYLGQGR